MAIEKVGTVEIVGVTTSNYTFDIYRYHEKLKANDVCCVYVFLKRMVVPSDRLDVLYIGQTKHLNDRWRAHKTDDLDKFVSKGMTHIGILKCKPDYLDFIEGDLIAACPHALNKKQGNNWDNMFGQKPPKQP